MIETIKGSVQKIIFKNDQTGFRVLSVKIPSGPLITMTGEFGPEVIAGTVAEFHGKYKVHPKYGTNFRVLTYNITHNAEELSSIKIFIDSIAPNIGPERADKIVNHFGSKIVDILDNNPERLMEVDGIGDVSANSLREAWIANRQKWDDLRQEFTLRAFLNALGIRERRIKRIINYFGDCIIAESSIRKNPYLLAEIEGFSFSTADFVARQLGIPENSPYRLRAFIYYALKILCPSRGHLYLTASELVQLINEYLIENNTSFIDKRPINLNDIKDVIDDMASEENGLIVKDNDALYIKKFYDFESYSAFLLSSIMETPSDLIFLSKDYVDDHIASFERRNNLTLSEEQKTALHYFVDKKIFIITGSPGTGKTLTLKVIVELILKLHLKLTCVTPTGISAKKLSETIGYNASTIHRAFEFRGNKWGYNENVRFETDILIIDEASMMDQEVFYRILLAIRERTHIIIVGDDNQLPSVSAGNVLRELINCGQIPTVRLEQIFRQNEASDIIKVAHKIKNGDTDLSLFKSDPAADVFFIREANLNKIEQFIIELAKKFKNEKRQFQIITPKNEGPLSVSTLNKTLQDILNPAVQGLKEVQCNDFILRKGDRIRIKKNDYENMIFNGDIGKIVDITDGFISILIDDRIVQLPIDDIEEKIKLAYSISVHGIQGNEYPYIILPFINQYGKMLLQRNLLYTAITRAKQKVIIIGHRSAIEKAINNSSVYKRNTRLGDRICMNLQLKKSGSSLSQLKMQVSFQPA